MMIRYFNCFILIVTFIYSAATTAATLSTVPVPQSVSAQKAMVGGEAAGLQLQDYYLAIPNARLESRLILLANVVTVDGDIAATPGLYIPKIVYFTRQGLSIFLMEEIGHQDVLKIFSPERILVELPIVEETKDQTVVDLKKGLNSLFVLNTGIGAVSVASSYLKDPVETIADFSITQVAKLAYPPLTVTLRYTFRYDAGSGIAAKYPDSAGRVGFITTPLYIGGGAGNTTKIRAITRWDIAQPIPFHLSTNTPPEYRDAIISGALAWNAAFGQEVVTVAMAPDGALAGLTNLNMIQWVENEAAGFAYAALQMHPITGEMARTVIVLPSAWVSEKIQAVIDDSVTTALPITLNGFLPSSVCTLHASLLTEFWEEMSTLSLSKAERKKLANALLRTVAMHEVGHALGLDHNFLGSLDTEFTPPENAADLQAFLDGTRRDDAPLPSGSVMDYNIYANAIRMTRPGNYDVQAIQWAYFWQNDPAPSIIHPYCSDEHVNQNADCSPHDAEAEPIFYYDNQVKHAVARFNDSIQSAWSTPNPENHSLPAFHMKRLLFPLKGLARYLIPGITVSARGGRSATERIGLAEEKIAPFRRSFPADASTIYQSPYITPEFSATLHAMERIAKQGNPIDAAWAAVVLEWVKKEVEAMQNKIAHSLEMVINPPFFVVGPTPLDR